MSVVQFPLDRLPQAGPIIISQSETSILVAIEVPRATLARHRRFLEMLLAAAVEPRVSINIPNDDQERLTQLGESYAPYCRFPAFDKGFAAYEGGNFRNPYDPNTADAEAWDRGHDCAMHWQAR